MIFLEKFLTEQNNTYFCTRFPYAISGSKQMDTVYIAFVKLVKYNCNGFN